MNVTEVIALNRPAKDKSAYLLVAWSLLAGLLLGGAAALTRASPYFEWQREVAEMPAVYLGFAMLIAGLCYGLLVPLIRHSLSNSVATRRGLWWGACAVGLIARLVLLSSEPALEDDYHRYLWEGALSARLINPYRVTPAAARQADASTPLGELARSGEAVLMRVNHPGITSNYPPVAQAAFALSHMIAPWNLTSWRLLVLTFDAATLAILVGLLLWIGQDRLWSLLYWWNPIVIKELANSAHMDSLIVMLVLGSLYLSAQRRHFGALLTCGLAIGTKLWPVLLVPLLLRPLERRPWQGLAGLSLIIGMTVLWLAPNWMGGPNPHDGYVAYAQFWRTNSALFPALEDLVGAGLESIGWQAPSWLVARSVIGAGLMVFAVWSAARSDGSASDVHGRAGLVILALVLLSPAQFPWYVIWVIPFAAFQCRATVVAMTALVPLYYASFHYIARGNYVFYADVVVWFVWLPVWLVAAIEVLAMRRRHCSSSPLDRATHGTGEWD